MFLTLFFLVPFIQKHRRTTDSTREREARQDMVVSTRTPIRPSPLILPLGAPLFCYPSPPPPLIPSLLDLLPSFPVLANFSLPRSPPSPASAPSPSVRGTYSPPLVGSLPSVPLTPFSTQKFCQLSKRVAFPTSSGKPSSQKLPTSFFPRAMATFCVPLPS